MAARLLGAAPHALAVRVVVACADTGAVLFEDSLSLRNASRVDYTGPPCERCTLSVVPAWNPSLRLSQEISLRAVASGFLSDSGSEPAQTPSPPPTPPPQPPTPTTEPRDPNKAPLVMAVGVGFLIVGPVCIGLFFYVNRRKEEGNPTALLAGSLSGA
jgi:hypothetical protein